MYKSLRIAAALCVLGFAQASLADTAPLPAPEPQLFVDFSYDDPQEGKPLVPDHAEAGLYRLVSTKRAVSAYKAEIAPLTHVEDMAARPPFWGPIDAIVIGLAFAAAFFMRLLMVRQRSARFADAIYVETIR